MREEWICTDSDSSQYCKVNSDGTYSFIEKVWLDTCKGDLGYPDKSYTVKLLLSILMIIQSMKRNVIYADITILLKH